MYKFSVIIPFSNDEAYIQDSIESVITQSTDSVEVILVDEGSADDSKSIALRYCERYSNIKALDASDFTLDSVNGKFVNFFRPDAKFEPGVFSNVIKYFSKVNLISISQTSDRIVDVTRDFDYPPIDYHSFFIKRDILNDAFMDFNEINRLILSERRFALTQGEYLNFLEREITKEFFDNHYIELLEYSREISGEVADFIKYSIACDMTRYYNVAASGILTKSELDEFQGNLRQVLSQIDDEFIIENDYVTPYVESFLMFLKNDEFKITASPDNVVITSKDYIINSFRDMQVIVDIVEIIDGTLNISLWFRSNCDYDFLRMQAIKTSDDGSKEIYDGKFFDYSTTNRYPTESIGYCWKFDYSCDFAIPIKSDEKSKITFNLIYEENGNHAVVKNPLQFQNYDAGLSKVSNYLIKDNHMVIYDDTDESLEIRNYSFLKSLKLETVTILKTIKDHNSSTLPAIFYHLLFLFSYQFMRNRRIWLFQDRVDIADDNAKHLFEYAISQDDGIEKYFVIARDSPDFEVMRKISKNTVARGSFKNKFLYLFCEKMISSHVNHSWLNPFFNPKRPYYNGLLTAEKCFLQHGVIKDDLSSWFRKYFQNLHLFLTSSDYERESILGDTYNYDESVVKAFGLPRHDNLKFGNAKREILFAPTWRKNLDNRAIFEKSDYFKRINKLINNEMLLNHLKDNRYKLIFKPHYDLLPFLDLFTIPDCVELSTQDSYQDLFNDSAVLVTDYSSVFFDFAFLKKPVIYYHEGDDYHYQEGYFDYTTMGFGDVVESEDDLVDRIIEYINNDCVMEDEYKSRVDRFFKYTDQRNCMRVYEWLQNH